MTHFKGVSDCLNEDNKDEEIEKVVIKDFF